MTREFIILQEFDRKWQTIGLDDSALHSLQEQLCEYPSIGVVMRGTSGLRKVRYALSGRGKSGSIRVLYVDFPRYKLLYLISLFTKNEKDNISAAERGNTKKIIIAIERELERRHLHE